jgi:acetyltransferase-like isoleucine patch superfamily enzyme
MKIYVLLVGFFGFRLVLFVIFVTLSHNSSTALHRRVSMLLIQHLRKMRADGYTVRKLLRIYFKSAICTAWFRAHGVQCPLVSCDGRIPVLHPHGRIRIGERFAILGPLLSSELGAEAPDAYLEIGDRVIVNHGSAIVAWSHIEIGSDTMIGEFVCIFDNNHHSLDQTHPTKSGPVIIGRNVWLCRGVVVLPGSKIGDHTVVSAGSVVRGELPPSVLAVGNPAQPVRKLDASDGWSRRDEKVYDPTM